MTKIHSLCFCRVHVVIFSIQFCLGEEKKKCTHTQALHSIQKHNQGHIIIGQFRELVVKSVKGPSCTKSIVYHDKPCFQKALIHPKQCTELPLCTGCYVQYSTSEWMWNSSCPGHSHRTVPEAGVIGCACVCVPWRFRSVSPPPILNASVHLHSCLEPPQTLGLRYV